MGPEALLKSMAEALPALFKCSRTSQEGVRVRTRLLYADGGVVYVIVLERDAEVRVSDLGEALGGLRICSVDAPRRARKSRRIEDMCQTLGMKLHRRQLVLRVGADGIIAETVLRVGQAAVRISHLR